MFRIQPSPRSRIPGSTRRVSCHGAHTLTSCAKRISSSVKSAKNLYGLDIALFTRMSTGPSSASTASTIASRDCVGSPRSAATGTARAPIASSCSSVSRIELPNVSVSRLRDTSPSAAPSDARRMASALPIPRLAPVISATLPAQLPAMSRPLLGHSRFAERLERYSTSSAANLSLPSSYDAVSGAQRSDALLVVEDERVVRVDLRVDLGHGCEEPPGKVVGAVDGDVLLRDQRLALILRLHVLELRSQAVGLVARGVVLLVRGRRPAPSSRRSPDPSRSSWESSASNADLYDQNALTTDCRSWKNDA